MRPLPLMLALGAALLSAPSLAAAAESSYVVVYKSDKAVLIKQFLRWEGDALILRQLNPERELRIPRAEVGECHLVVGVDQEG